MLTRPVQWQGATVEAAVPARLAQWDPELSTTTVRRTERAGAAVQRFGDRLRTRTGAVGVGEAAARLLLRSEGLASSSIEGLRAPAAAVAIAEITDGRPEGDQASWVADNLAVIIDALGTPPPLTTGILLGWHERLMRHASTVEARHVGGWRDVLGWVGGPNPRLAAHVAAPAEDVPNLMEDLMTFVGRDDLDPVTLAAVAHAQFETIHPFADGNGRIGRVIVGWILRSRLQVNYPPPISLQMARDVGGYQAGLTLYRQEEVDAWVAWFADAVTAAAEASTGVLDRVGEVQDQWRRKTSDLRSDSAARRLCELLPAHPVLSALTAAGLLRISRQAAAIALVALEGRGIVVPLQGGAEGRNPRERWWAAQSMLDLLGTR